MTDKEKAIVMAYTGVCMLTGNIWTHELADERVTIEIKEKSKKDFINLCESEE